MLVHVLIWTDDYISTILIIQNLLVLACTDNGYTEEFATLPEAKKERIDN
jgi:hypothetical protein